jgi:penicillin amidase
MTPEELDFPAARLIAAWDGSHAADSAGALAFEVLFADLARRLVHWVERAVSSAIPGGRTLIAEAIGMAPAPALRHVMPRALRRTARTLERLGNWGGAHRLVPRHHMAALPVIGRRYRFGDFAAAGSNDTLNVSGHPMTSGRHQATSVAGARFIADMSDANANRLVLLGGQDGWIGSDTFLDQLPIWRDGGYVDVPLDAERARAWPHHTVHPPVR